MKHTQTFTHGAVVKALFLWIVERSEFYLKSPVFCIAAGAHHGDAKVDNQVENEKMAMGFNASHCGPIKFNSASCQCQSR